MPESSERTYAQFSVLSGNSVSIVQIQTELNTIPLDAILGCLAAIAWEATQYGQDFYLPEYQGKYMNWALVDNFPSRIQRVSNRIKVGYPPNVGSNDVLVHTQNTAWLTHQALLHCERDIRVESLELSLWQRVARLLLIANDHISIVEQTANITNLVEKRHVALGKLRLWQFSESFELEKIMRSIMRQQEIFLEILPSLPKPYTYDIQSKFFECTNGINLHVYYATFLILYAHLFPRQLNRVPNTETQATIYPLGFNKQTFFNNFQSNQNQASTVLNWCIASPNEYTELYADWVSSRNAENLVFDQVQLRTKPLIETRPDDVLLPVPNFLFQKVVDGPFFIMSNCLTDKSERNLFQRAVGPAYETYANRLVEKIAANDSSGEWTLFKNPKAGNSSEITDALLFRDGIAVVVEHKALRLSTDFLTGGNGDRVLGPSDALLEQLINGEKTIENLSEDDNWKKDMIFRVMVQQTRSSSRLFDYVENTLGRRIEKVFPLNSHLANIHIDETISRGYIEPLLQQTDLYVEDYWEFPQWINIEDLEVLANLANEGQLDFYQLLEDKGQGNNKYLSFNQYLANMGVEVSRDESFGGAIQQAAREAGELFFPDTYENN